MPVNPNPNAGSNCRIIIDNAIGNYGKMGADEFDTAVDGIKLELDNLEGYRLQQYQEMAKTREAAEYAQIMVNRTRMLQNMFDLVELKPGESNAVLNFAALAMDWTLGKVGQVKRTIDMQRESAASMLEYAVRTSVSRAVTELQNTIDQMLPNASLYDKRLLGLLSVEIGALGAELEGLSTSPLSKVFNENRFNRFQSWASSNYGLTPEQINELARRGIQVGAAEEEIRILAKSLGLSVDRLNDLGYIHRSYTRLGLARLEDIRGRTIGSNLDQLGIGTHPLSGLSRQFNFIQPTTQEALVLFAELTGLTKGKVYESFASTGKPHQWLQGRAKDIQDAVQVTDGKVLELVIGETSKDKDRVQSLYRKLREYTKPRSSERVRLTRAFKDQDYFELSQLAVELLRPQGYDAVSFVDRRTGDGFLLNWSATLEKVDATGELMELFSNPYALTEFIRERLTVNQIDQLVDSGLLNILPMSSVEIMELLNGMYGMSFDNLGQLMEVDLMTASYQYTESLKNAARQGAMIQILTDGRAEAAGWVIPATDPVLRDRAYKDYVTIGDKFNEHFININGKAPTKELEELLVEMGLERKSARDLASSKAHPIVANVINQYIATSWNASVMGIAGQTVMEVSQDALKYGVAEGGLGYIDRNIAEAYFGASWFGFNPGRIKEAFDIFRGLSRTNDLSFISDRPWAYFEGRQISKREAVEMYMQHFSANSASDMPTIENGYIAGGFRSWLYKLQEFPTHIKKWYEYVNADPSQYGRAQRSTFQQFKRIVNGTYKGSVDVLDEGWVRIVSMAHQGEMSVKLAFWLSQFEPIGTKGKSANWFGYLATGGYYQYSRTFEEVSKRMQDAFINPNTMGWLPRSANTWYGNFLQYAVKAPYQMGRAVVTNPARLYRWHRAHSMWNQIQQIRYEPTEAGFADWELEERPHYLGQTQDKFGRPMNVLLFPQGYDSFSRVWTTIDKTGKSIQTIMGDPPTGQRKLAQIKGEGPLAPESIANEVARNAGRLQQALVEQLTGERILTGQSLDLEDYEKRPSFLFWNPHPRTVALVRSAIPALGYVDDLNLFGMFGQPQIEDASGRILEEGVPGLRGVERYPARALDLTRTSDNMTRWFVLAFKLAGANVRISSVEDNIANNLAEVSFVLRDLERGFNESLRDLQFEAARGVIDQSQWERRDKATSDLLAQIYWLSLEEIRLTLLAGEYGIIPSELQSDIFHATVNSYTTLNGLPPQVHRELQELHNSINQMGSQYEDIRNGQTSTTTEEQGEAVR